MRVRFAPSPTGTLHLGSARTALFNYLFARHFGGTAILRIEDTDVLRSRREFEAAQIRDLAWLGLRFNEGPYRQSDRGDLYRQVSSRLLEEGIAYHGSDETGREALYFKPPAREGYFRDELRGNIKFSKIEDFVILKSNGTPTYNFAATVDDISMRITHVLRGEDHLSNTARQVLLYDVLGEKKPEFIHLGVILGPDGKKLSKRHGAASVAEYRAMGYLPEALIGYLALLGWSHSGGREEFADLEDLVSEWDPSRIGTSPANFDPARLDWVNSRRIRAFPPRVLWERVKPFAQAIQIPEGRELAAMEAVCSELHTLADAPRLLEGILKPVNSLAFVAELPAERGTIYAHVSEVLEGKRIDSVQDARELVQELRRWAKESGISARDLLHSLRLALTGEERGPEMPYLLAVLGPEEARRRIDAAREARD